MSAATRRKLLAFAPVVLLVILLVIFTVADPRIASPTNLRNVALQATPVALLALAAYVVLVSGGIDLSAGFAVGLCGVVIAGQLAQGAGLPVALGFGLLAAGAVGLLNGVLIGVTRLPPFVATLGTMTIAQGLTMFASVQGLIIVNNAGLLWLGQGSVLGIPVPIVLVAGVSAVLWFLMRHTRFGLRTYAHGSDAEKSVLAGVRPMSQLLFVYLTAGFLVWVTAVLLVGQVALVQPNLGGIELLLDAIAAAVLGGTSIYGGRGSVGGVLVGALVISLLTNALQVFGVDASSIQLFKGLIILVALVADTGMRVLYNRSIRSQAWV